MTSKGALFIVTTGAALAMSASAYAGSCSRLSMSGTAVMHELATTLAKGFLADEIALRGAKGRGPVRVSCKYDLVVSTCTASQRICK
jgi:hypothetical protein